MRRPRFGRLRNLIITTTICITVAVPAAYLMSPHIERWMRMSELVGDDPDLRERAVNYIIRTAPTDQRVMAAAIDTMSEADEETALLVFRALHHAQLVGRPGVVEALLPRLREAPTHDAAMRIYHNLVFAQVANQPAVRQAMFARMANVDDEATFYRYIAELDRVGAWTDEVAPVDLWLRSLALMLDDPDPMARVLAVHRIADLHVRTCDERISAMLEKAVADEDASVRYAAVLAAAEMALTPTCEAQRPALESVIGAGTRDADVAIARDAWMLLALLDPWTGFTGDWRSADPAVAEAMLYAAIRTNPSQPRPALEALEDREVDLRVRAAAAYALHMATDKDFPNDDDDELVRWRLALSVPPERLPPPPPLGHADPAGPPNPVGPTEPEPATPVDLAHIHREAMIVDAKLAESIFDERFGEPPLMQLAVLEGLPVDRAKIPITRQTPDMIRLAAVAVTIDPNPDDLLPLFESPESTLRDLACIVAADRFDQEQNSALVKSLLWNYNDDAKCSGAILAGLTGVQRDLLKQKAQDEDIWTVQQIMHLGLWMQGEKPEMGERAAAMLSRDDLPQSTVLLAMLHQRQTRALDYLFAPRAGEPLPLLELLDHYRWSRVLYHFLPETAPPLWHWADPALKQFQIDLLRNWYLIHRQSLWSEERGT